jgi:RNA recognition motif-containing protein
MATKSLYVGNLSYNATEEELRELFAAWGPVSEARIVVGRGFGFVDVPEENMQAAIDSTNGKEFQGRALTVNEARPREPRSGGGGSRGGYGGGGGGGGSRSRGPRW